MSFFGFEETNLEKEKRKFQDQGLKQTEDLAVYTWGEDSYDGLGDALQEERDDLNDETFGDAGAVGKDFDFSTPALPTHDAQQTRPQPRQEQSQPQPKATHNSLESIWDDKSLSAFLPRSSGNANGGGRSSAMGHGTAEMLQQQRNSPSLGHHQAMSQGINQRGIRTLQEVEAEMRAVAQQQARDTALRQQEQEAEEEILLRRQHEILYARQQKELQQQERQRLQEQLLQQQLRQQELTRQQEQQSQLHRLWEHQQMHQYQNLHQRTPPPRMLPQSQSPRFQENLQQRQLLLLQQQQQQEQQQQLRLQELQEQLRMEEIERQLRVQSLNQSNHSPNHFNGRRHAQSPSLVELQALQALHHRRQRSQSPGYVEQPNAPNVLLQQRLLNEMAQADIYQGLSPADQEALRMEAMRKILEAEKMEEKRRRKAAKIAHMSHYNDLMTQSDKDFITRIQVSQLVTQDPYADDFYAQVYGAIIRNRMGIATQDERVIKFGASGGVGLGVAQKGSGRRPSAMQKMEQQVERIVSNARLREKEKQSFNSLQGALGKTSGRSYKAAPRQLLQVDATNASTSPTLSHAHAHISKEDATSRSDGGTPVAADEAAKLGRAALGLTAEHAEGLVRMDPLTNRQVLVMLEGLYDLVLRAEQLRRDQPKDEDEEAQIDWQIEFDEVVDELFNGMKVMAPLQISDPHPFISLLGPTKGKKLLPRIARHLPHQRLLTMLTLIVACFSQLDVVKHAPYIDSVEETPERVEAERQTSVFLGSVLQSVLTVIAKSNLRIVTGFLGLLLDKTNIVEIALTRPGLALLTLFLSRVEVIKQNMTTGAADDPDYPTAEEAQQWQMMFDHLFQLLTPSFLQLFPSYRLAPLMPEGMENDPAIETLDQPVWQFLAALALHAVTQQQQVLVTSLREKVLHNVMSANKGWVADEDARQTKLANVNLFLNALGLDSSQIAM